MHSPIGINRSFLKVLLVLVLKFKAFFGERNFSCLLHIALVTALCFLFAYLSNCNYSILSCP